MEAMIKRIVEMDCKAQEMLANAQKEKIEAEQYIAEKAMTLQQNYLDQARRRIRIDTENDRTLFEQRWKRRQLYYDRQSRKMDEQYAAKHDEWIETLVTTACKPTE